MPANCRSWCLRGRRSTAKRGGKKPPRRARAAYRADERRLAARAGADRGRGLGAGAFRGRSRRARHSRRRRGGGSRKRATSSPRRKRRSPSPTRRSERRSAYSPNDARRSALDGLREEAQRLARIENELAGVQDELGRLRAGLGEGGDEEELEAGLELALEAAKAAEERMLDAEADHAAGRDAEVAARAPLGPPKARRRSSRPKPIRSRNC